MTSLSDRPGQRVVHTWLCAYRCRGSTVEGPHEKVIVVRFVISRRVRLFAATAIAGLLLVGCSGPSQVGAAAVIGDTRIPLNRVQDWFDTVLEKEPELGSRWREQGQLDELGRQLASFTVQQELVEQAAQRSNVSVSEQRVTERINKEGGVQAATDGKLNTPGNIRAAVRTELLATELGRKYLDRISVTFDSTQATTRKEAKRKAEAMAQGAKQTAALFEAERAAGVPVSRDESLHAADSAQLAAATPLFGAEPGTVVAFEASPQSGRWLVVRVTDRSTNSPAAKPVAGQTGEQILRSFGMRLVGEVTDRTEVRLNPRYGVWDQVALAAAPNENETLGFWFGGPSDLAS